MQLQQLREAFVPRGMASSVRTFASSATGVLITDADGREYLDFAGGISVVNVGHGHPRVLDAIVQQARTLIHSAVGVMMPEVYVRLAQRLCEITPGNFPKKALLLNSGAEAVENAVKIVRQATGRQAIISFHNSFHGRTLLCMSLTGKAAPYKQSFGPYAPEIYQVPYPYSYRQKATSSDNLADSCIEALVDVFRTTVPATQVAGVIVEPVQGEGGYIVPPSSFLPKLAELCRKHSIPLIVDEIQTGFGRTGKLFAVEHTGVEPDILVLAKSLAGGLPLSAVVGRAELMDAPEPGGLGGTFAGNPICCAAALAAIDVMLEEQLPERGAHLGEIALQHMSRWQGELPCIGEVRGLGAMLAIELVKDLVTREPASDLTLQVINECQSRGVIVMRAGLFNNVIRLMMPLTMSTDQLERGLSILRHSLMAAAKKLAT